MRSFSQYAAAGFEQDLLPIIPPDAKVSPDSPSYDSLAKNLGKVPGQKRLSGWNGFGKWTEAAPSSDDLTRWTGWKAGIGMQGRRFPALDIDVNDPDLANLIQDEAFAILGPAPVRFGNGSRRILVYSASGLRKVRLPFQKPGSADKPEPKVEAVEFLAYGQFYVVEGIHPKTNAPYRWADEESPVEVGPDRLTTITKKQVDRFFDRLETILTASEYEVSRRSTQSAKRGAINPAALLAPSMDAVRMAMSALPNEVGYDDWVMLGAAIRGSAGPDRLEEAYEIWLDWSLQRPEDSPDGIREKWIQIGPDVSIGWNALSRFVATNGDGSFNGAEWEFDAVAEPSGSTPIETARVTKLDAMYARYAWVEALAMIIDLRTKALLTIKQFNVRHNDVGPPAQTGKCAWAVFSSNADRMQRFAGVTYRPGGPQFVDESLPAIEGRCVNQWADPTTDLPATASDADVQVWLDHVAFVITDQRERAAVLNWLAWIVQNPGQKPNWAIVIGSTAEGIGKDAMMAPVRVALGPRNVREIGPEDLASSNSDYLLRTRLLIVEEMDLADRKATMNRLKPLIASPPETLRVNIKFLPQFEVPNILAAVFFTNQDNALAFSRHGRRYFVVWNDGQPRTERYYSDLFRWYEEGGAERAARWLLDRNLDGFNPKGRAPETAARDVMRLATRTRSEEIIEDGLGNREGPFAHRLFSLEEVFDHLLASVEDRRLTHARVRSMMVAAGCVKVRRIAIGDTPAGHVDHRHRPKNESTLYCRTTEPVDDVSNEDLRALYWVDREESDAAF